MQVVAQGHNNEILNNATNTAEEKSINALADADEQKSNFDKAKASLTNNTSTQFQVAEMKQKALNLHEKSTEIKTKFEANLTQMIQYDGQLLSLLEKIATLSEKLDKLTIKRGGIMAKESHYRKC